MDQSKKILISPESMLHPAFIVKDGIVTEVNEAAANRQIAVGIPVRSILKHGLAEYDAFTDGRLDLTLCMNGYTCGAYVIACRDGQLFCMESEYVQPELRAFSLAAMHLREPLTNAMLCANALLPEVSENKESLAQINRSLYQMMRILGNMSDAAQYSKYNAKLQSCNVVAVFREILDKAEVLLSKGGKQLHYQVPAQAINGICDPTMVERAILNLISNAAGFSQDGIVTAQLDYDNKRFRFTVTNKDSNTKSAKKDVFERYLREPQIEDGRNGIGLGLPLVRSVAAAHGGAVLMQYTEHGEFRISMTLAAQKQDTQILRSPVQLPIDDTGGWDRCLLELSGILSADLYSE